MYVPTHVCICIYVRLHVHIYRVCMHCKSYNVFFCTRPTAGLLFVVLVGLNLLHVYSVAVGVGEGDHLELRIVLRDLLQPLVAGSTGLRHTDSQRMQHASRDALMRTLVSGRRAHLQRVHIAAWPGRVEQQCQTCDQ